MTDQQLLDRYRHQGDRDAFAELVGRHAQLVYAAAQRLARADAEDVAQAVFLLLSQKAKAIRPEPSLAGWLYQATRHCARNALKMRQRRQHHERKAAAMHNEARSDESDGLRELLDVGLASLGASYRQVLLLRYLEALSLEETAGRLGITVPAVAKRAERGLEKLRKVMAPAGRGTPTAALATAMAQEASQHLPVGLPDKLTSVPTASPGSTITQIAAGAGRSLMLAKIAAITKVAAVVLVVVGGVGLPAANLLRPATTGPIVNEADPAAPGQVRLVRTKLWVDAKVATALKAAGKPVNTKSQWYGAMLMLADAVHRALATVPQMGTDLSTLYWPDRPISWSGYGVPPSGIGIGKNPSSVVRIEPSFDGKREYRRKSDGLELELALAGLKAIYFTAEGETKVPAAIAFDGLVPGGMALVFLGGFDTAGAYCLDIWEAVRMTDAQARAMRGVQPQRWFTQTPAEWRDVADRATVWQSGGKSVDQSDRITQRIGSSLDVQLLGISRPDKWPGCWWTPAGQPIGGVTGYPDTAKPVAVVQVPTGPVVQDGRMQYAHEWSSTGTAVRPGSQETVVELPDELGRLHVEIAGAQWTRLGLVDQLHPLVAGPVQVKVIRAEMLGSTCTVTLSYSQLPDEALQLVALDADGNPVGHPFVSNLIRMPAARTTQSATTRYMQIEKLKSAPARFAVELSPYQSVRFEGFAMMPAVPPPASVAAPQLKQAEDTETERRVAAAHTRWVEAQKRYEAVPADDATPAGLFKQMIEAASAGRTDDVVACFSPVAEESQKQQMRTFARVLSATVQCSDLVLAKFGLDQIVRDQVKMKSPTRYDQMLYDWKIDDDVATTAGMKMRRIDGHWRVEPAGLTEKMTPTVVRWAEALEGIRAAVTDGRITTTSQLNDAMERLPKP